MSVFFFSLPGQVSQNVAVGFLGRCVQCHLGTADAVKGVQQDDGVLIPLIGLVWESTRHLFPGTPSADAELFLAPVL